MSLLNRFAMPGWACVCMFLILCSKRHYYFQSRVFFPSFGFVFTQPAFRTCVFLLLSSLSRFSRFVFLCLMMLVCSRGLCVFCVYIALLLPPTPPRFVSRRHPSRNPIFRLILHAHVGAPISRQPCLPSRWATESSFFHIILPCPGPPASAA